MKDHLGNIKVTVDGSGNVVGYDDYYPYGMQMPGRNSVASADARYKYNGKELDAETNLYYYGARNYDSWKAGWYEVDPSQDKYPSISPYAYVLDNPIRLYDTDGKEVGDGSIDLIHQNREIAYLKGNISKEEYLSDMKTEGEVGLAGLIGQAIPEVISAVVSLWVENPLKANEIANGVEENLSNAPVGSSELANLGKTYGKLGTVIGKEGISIDKVLIEGHGADMMYKKGVNKALLKEILESPEVKLKQGNKEVYITEEGVAVIDPNNQNKLVTTYSKDYFKDDYIKQALEESKPR